MNHINTITIKEMTPNDWESVATIYQQGLDTNMATFQTVCPSYEEWDIGHLKDCRYVAQKDGFLTGWIALSATSQREVYRGVVEVSIYIDPTYKKQGIGTTLMNHMIVESEKKEYWMLYSSIIEENTSSIQLHKKTGFRQIGFREKIAKDRFGTWHNTILFERRNGFR